MGSDSDSAFRDFAHAIETDPFDLLLAKWRREVFTTALRKLPGVAEVIPSGSLARGTQVGPIHDLDLIVVFRKSHHPQWGQGGASAAEALEHLRAGIEEGLGAGRGPASRVVRHTEARNHVVKCRDVSLGPFEGIIPSAPPVDVMPAIRAGSHLRVPERLNGRWVDVDPEKLMRLVEERKREWKYFDEVVWMVKYWVAHSHLDLPSVAIEVLVLKYLPRPRFFETLTCGEAVTRFFEAAAKADIHGLRVPGGREIAPGFGYGSLRHALGRAAGLARKAMDAEHGIENPGLRLNPIEDPSVFWRQLFGRRFPRWKKRFLHAQYCEPLTLPAKPPEPAEADAERGWGGGFAEGPGEGRGHPQGPQPEPEGEGAHVLHQPEPPQPGPRGDVPYPGRRPDGREESAEPAPDRWEELIGTGGLAAGAAASAIPAATFG
jgi:hypothetical protein